MTLQGSRVKAEQLGEIGICIQNSSVSSSLTSDCLAKLSHCKIFYIPAPNISKLREKVKEFKEK